MIKLNPVTMATAEALLDFAGKSQHAKSVAGIQREGAVALHNILCSGRAAYLADEVGMGKTYVVLGTIALLRHFHPRLRVLYIVPRANLQRKWRKEIRNFTAHNWRVTDHRVKTFQNTPVVEPVLCENLLDLVRETALDAHRDFILRLTSFSLPLSEREGGGKAWREKAAEVRRAFPGLAESALAVDGRNPNCQEQFKDSFACAVNALLPHFDLLVLDEGHNLKHGFREHQGATRNRLLAYVLGTKKGPSDRQPLQRRVDRAVLLSATPVDAGFEDLWNQLDLLGLADGFDGLKDQENEERSKQAAARCLIRRLTHISIGGKPHTRNMYRREWRGGGVERHDNALKVPDDLQRFIVALMQKKVADVLAEQGRKQQKRFSRSFQIGMLASFESFGRTARATGEEANFDQLDQTDDARARQGIDSSSVNEIAASYREKFGESPPHPKMDEVAKELWRAFLAGQKTLVFVRRIHSVPEMVEKLTQLYNDWLRKRIASELSALSQDEREQLDRVFNRYEQERKDFYSRGATAAFAGGQARANDLEPLPQTTEAEESEPGGFESFFSWFFRGKGPGGILSGASFSLNRLEKPSALLSTLFEDNWLLTLLEYPDDPLSKLGGLVCCEREQLCERLRARAAVLHPPKKAQKRLVFHAYQQAALELLASQKSDQALAEKAKVILAKLDWLQPQTHDKPRRGFPSPERYLGLRTFFTELVRREKLCEALWPAPSAPSSKDAAFGEVFLEKERRRRLLSSAIRLGHPMVDLWLLYVQLAGTLAPGKLDEADAAEDESPAKDVGMAERLAAAFVDLLDRQRTATGPLSGPTSFMELSRLATDFPLLVDVNFHEMRSLPLSALSNYIADRLGQQQPIAGMHGGVLRRTVSQFRMPGYPYVLITTDVLQEGEDLHTFCDRIVHYGISWTPSAMEQRTGRVDRIGSLVQRRLETPEKQAQVTENDFLQAYFPYLRDTYEYVQVGVVFGRLNRFLEMLHDLRLSHGHQSSEVEVGRQIHEKAAEVFKAFREPLKSGFEIAETLTPKGPLQPILNAANVESLAHFQKVKDALCSRFYIADWHDGGHQCGGVAFVCEQGLVARLNATSAASARRQPFSLALRTTHGGALLLRCETQIGAVSDGERIEQVFALQRKNPELKICAVRDEDGCFRLSARRDLLFLPQTTQWEEVEEAFASMLASADRLENTVFEGKDHTGTELAFDSDMEADDGKN